MNTRIENGMKQVVAATLALVLTLVVMQGIGASSGPSRRVAGQVATTAAPVVHVLQRG